MSDAMEERERARPSAAQIRRALAAGRRQRVGMYVAAACGGLLCVAALVIVLATFLFPPLRIFGTSMEPVLREDQVVVSMKAPSYGTGDIVAFYYNNKILVKRVICGPGDWLNMDEEGTVYVNGMRLDEPYIAHPALGACDLELPYQVPDGEYFVMGDERATSVDSRMAQVGCVPRDRIVGRIILRVWPLNTLGPVS